MNYETAKQYGSVARVFELCERSHNLTFDHHLRVMAAPEDERQDWLQKAIEGDGDGKPWSSNQLRAAIKQGAAFQRTSKVELEAAAIRSGSAAKRTFCGHYSGALISYATLSWRRGGLN